ncbi:unnamed protein product, partial [Porites lobata]
MAVTLCSYIPFPQHIEYIQSCSQLQILTLYSPAVTSDLANVLHSGLSGNTTLSEFTLQVSGSIPCDAAVVIGEWLAATKSLKEVTFLLNVVQDETWASAIETGLCADTAFTSVVLEVRGPMITKDWPHLLGDALAENMTLTALDLTVNNYIENKELGRELGISLLRSCSLTVLNLAIINYSNIEDGWECTLVNSLARMASLTTLSLAIDDRGGERKCESENDDLIALKSLTTLSVVMNGSNLDEFWSNFLRKCLEGNASLKKLCLVANNVESDIDFLEDTIGMPEYWGEGLADGLARTTSLNDLALTINNINSTDYYWATSVCNGLSNNESVTNLAVTVSDYHSMSAGEYAHFLKMGLTTNKSLTTLTLTV